MAFKVIWDNGNDCGELSGGPFETEEQAEQFGEDWRNEMIVLSDDPEEADEAYSFEIIEEDDDSINDRDEEARWYEELNKGYAQDRI